MTTDAGVSLWGSQIGALTWLEDRRHAVFQYTPDFLHSGVEVAPLTMPLAEAPYAFPTLAYASFLGLPGLLADSLPDAYGHALIDAWLVSRGQAPASFHPVRRLCYVGRRGMGALEFEPAEPSLGRGSRAIDVAALVELAADILSERSSLSGSFTGRDDTAAIEEILRVGSSAGGARAKAILAWNPRTQAFCSGQVDLEAGFEHWLMKFDGVADERELLGPQGYGKIEFAYHAMARDAGITMTDCRLHHEGGRSHFMTRRFDRTATGDKRHMQSLGAMAHFDYRQPASHSYEQAIDVIRRLALPREDLEQQVLRAMFNVVARNQDDHVKNIAFLMDRDARWRLAPAYDVTFAWTTDGIWTCQHQMSINGKRDNFRQDDLLSLAARADIKRSRALELLERVTETIAKWPKYAASVDVAPNRARAIAALHRLSL